MRFALVGMMAAVALVAAALNAWAQPGPPVGQSPGVRAPEATIHGEQPGMIALLAPAGEKYQQVIVIDSRESAMCVYHIDVATGVIELKSVRKIQYDLKMVQFNGTSPLPQEIRAKIEQLR